MAQSIPNRKAEAGWLLARACEEILGVEGPVALAAVTRRSQAWWSKLRLGQAAFPSWRELAEEVLPQGLPDEARDRLRPQHQEAWVLLQDGELAARLRAPALPDLPGERLTAVRQLA